MVEDSSLAKPMDRGAWSAAVHGVTMMTQMRGPRSSKELILHHVMLGDLLQWKWFLKTWVGSATVIEMYHLPHSLFLKSS